MRNPHFKHDISTFIFCNFEDMYQNVMFDTPKIAEYLMQKYEEFCFDSTECLENLYTISP